MLEQLLHQIPWQNILCKVKHYFLTSLIALTLGTTSLTAQQENHSQTYTTVLGAKYSDTSLKVFVRDSIGFPAPNKRVIIDNGSIADTLITDRNGEAIFINKPVFTGVDDMPVRINLTQYKAAAKTTGQGAKFLAKFPFQNGKKRNGQGKLTIYNIQGKIVHEQPIQVNNGWVQTQWKGINKWGESIATGIYPYQLIFEGEKITGILNTSTKNLWSAKDYEHYKELNNELINNSIHSSTSEEHKKALYKTNGTSINLRIEAIKNMGIATKTIFDHFQINEGAKLQKTYIVTEMPSKVDYIIYAKDINTKEPIEGVTIDLIRGGEIKYSATSDDNGIIIMNDVKTPGYNAYIYAPEGYYGVSNIGFLVPQPWSEKELKDTLIVYLWNKDRPLPGTNRTIRPTLEEIKEMAPAEPNIQRALGKEVHSINTSYYPEEQLKNAQAFYHHVDSLVYNGEWNIQLRLNQPFETSISYGASFTLENIDAYGYNVTTNGGSNNEHYGKKLIIARAPPQNYTTVGTAYISGFQGKIDTTSWITTTQGKEIVFRLGDYVPVGSRNSIGNSRAEWFTETDRALLYSYLVHNRATLTNYKVIYYRPRQLSE